MEMVVVVTIIILLTALLMPALKAARQAAFSTNCRSNLHQIGIAHASYRNAHGDYNMPALSPEPVGNWINLCYVNGGLNHETIYQCPALTEDAMFNPYGGDGAYDVKIQASYVMNACRASRWNGADLGSLDPDGCVGWTTGFVTQGPGLPYTKPLRTTLVNDISDKIFITDTAMSFRNLTAPNRSCAGAYIDRYAQTDHGPVITGTSYANFRNVGAQHEGKFNCLMGDNHVATLEKSSAPQWVAYEGK
jgi:prepilin-type processing-associated H-X9-DG protein